MATKRRGAGTEFYIGSTSDPLTAVFTKLAQVRNIKITRANGEVEVSDLDATAKQYISDLPDGGNATFEVYYDPGEATHAEVTGLEALLNSGETRAFRVKPNGATKYRQFVGFVRTGDQNFEPTAAMMMSGEIRISGAITYPAVS